MARIGVSGGSTGRDHGRRTRHRLSLGVTIAATVGFVIPCGQSATADERAGEVSAGEFVTVYDPGVGEKEPWYINDHTFVQDRDGTWHLFGITHEEPPDPEDEDHFAHATAPSLDGPWTKRPFALDVDASYGETHLWAPHVIEAYGLYFMFYNGGGDDHSAYQMNLAVSRDLRDWTRYPGGPLFRDGYDARDPFVTRVGARWVMYYTATSSPEGGNHTVMYRTSLDLVHWGERHTAFTDPEQGTVGGGTESPYVVRRGGHWYLFIGPRPGYVGTDVFVSDDPFDFSGDERFGHVDAHAAEVIDDHGDWYVSAAGWGQGGVHLAELRWPD